MFKPTLPLLTLTVFLALGLWAASLRLDKPRVAGVQSSVTVRPGESIQAALAKAKAGTTIVVESGTYQGKLVTARSGTSRAPITLKARGPVTLVGDGSGRLFQMKHDYYRIEGFEFKNADILLWLEGANHAVVTKNFFHHAQGECVRAKYHSSHNLFSHNRVEDCGREDFVEGGDGKNGEGIYLGTAPEQLDRNPTSETDQTNHNVVHRNVFKTNGNECVDIKEGSSNNVVEFNDCMGQKDPESGGFDSRGNGNTFRYNKSYGNAGAGIRFGGDEVSDGVKNSAYNNQLLNNAGYALKVMRLPQGKICGNTGSGNGKGLTNEETITNDPC